MRKHITTLLVGACVALNAAAGMAQNTPSKGASVKAPEYAITLETKPATAKAGENEFIVTVVSPEKQPVTGAEVTVSLQMPAMPSMNMPEMKNSVTLKPVSDKAADVGKYGGKGQIMMAGQWNVSISVKVDKKEVASKKQTLTAR